MILMVFTLLLRLSVSDECQTGEIHAEDTPTLKSVKRVFDTRVCTLIMTYFSSWNVCYLYYFNGLTLLGPISGIDHTYCRDIVCGSVIISTKDYEKLK